MFSQSDDEQLGLVLGLVFALVLSVIGLTVAVALHRSPAVPATAEPPVSTVPVPAVAAVATVAPAVPLPPSAQASSDAASITVEYGVVKFYFASGSAELAGGAADALVDVVKAAKGGKKVLIAGFHDSKGSAAANADLARRRALAVQRGAAGRRCARSPDQPAKAPANGRLGR